MQNVVFIEQSLTSRGRRHADMTAHSFDSFVNGKVTPNRYTVRVAYINGKSMAMEHITLKEFEQLFSTSDIRTMQENGLLNYYPSSNWGTCYKYPMFQASVYLKHGIEK